MLFKFGQKNNMDSEVKVIKDITREKNYCIFENELCMYANNIRGSYGGSFNCTAPSDESMNCKKY